MKPDVYSPRMSRLFSFIVNKHPRLSTFKLLCFIGCLFQMLSVVHEFSKYNIVVEIDIDGNDSSYMPAITISNDFFMFLNQTKIVEEFETWRNLSTLARTRNFLSLPNMTSKVKFSFLYDRNILLENCSVFDIYGSNVSKETIDEYEKVSEKFKTEKVNKEDFSKMNLSLYGFKPPYVQSRKCREIADFYVRTEYKDLTGWSDHLWYLTLFHRTSIRDDRFKFTKMGNEILLSLNWEILVADEIEFGFKIHFHSPDQAPTSKHAAVLGINGRAFKWVTLGYSHSIANFLKPPFRTNCYEYLDHNFKSRQDCIDTCKLDISKSHCDALPLHTLMEVEMTADFINKKEHAQCFKKFNIGLYCEQKCYRKDCIADYYTASILSEVSQSRKSLIIDIVKPNTGVNQEFNYKQSMKVFELILYCGSTLSLWYGISVYGIPNYLNSMSKVIKIRKNGTTVKGGLFRRAKRIFNRSAFRKTVNPLRTPSNKTMNSLLSYRTLNTLGQHLDRLEKDEHIKFKEKLGINYNGNMDHNYRNNLTYYYKPMSKEEAIKFIVLDRDPNNFVKK